MKREGAVQGVSWVLTHFQQLVLLPTFLGAVPFSPGTFGA